MIVKKNFLRKNLTVKSFGLVLFSFSCLICLLKVLTKGNVFVITSVCSIIGIVGLIMGDRSLQKVDDENTNLE